MNTFFSSRRMFLPDHAADMRILFKSIQNYENEQGGETAEDRVFEVTPET